MILSCTCQFFIEIIGLDEIHVFIGYETKDPRKTELWRLYVDGGRPPTHITRIPTGSGDDNAWNLQGVTDTIII